MADPGPSQSPNVDADWARFGCSSRLRFGFPDRRDPRIIPVGWTCCRCQHKNAHPDAYGKPAEIEPGNTDYLKPCAGVNCRSRKRDHDGNELDPSPHSLCPKCALINHKRHPIMSGIGVPAASSDHIDRAEVAFWECCHCLKLNKIYDSAFVHCYSCHFQSQGPGHCRKPDHPRLQIEALDELWAAQKQCFDPPFVDTTVSNAKPPTLNQPNPLQEKTNHRNRRDAYRKVEKETSVKVMLSAHVTCGDCRLLNGYKEYLIFADKEKRRFVKGGVLWGGVKAKLLEWQQTNKRAPTPVEKAALLAEFEKHVWDQFRVRAKVDACFRTIDRFKRYRAEKVVHKSSVLGNCDPNLYPQCDMKKTKKIMLKDVRATTKIAMKHEQPAAILMFRQKYRIMRDHGYFRDTRLVYKVPKTDLRLITVGLVNRERTLSANTAEQDEVEAEAYQQRRAAAQRRHAELLQRYIVAGGEYEAAFQRILDDSEEREQAGSSATNGHAHQTSPSAS